jgi:16S rRNA (uracil1498-N3)-methyltransferase
MARRRFFVDRVHGGKALVEGDTAEHLRRVLRAEPGQQYELSDNESVYLAEIEGFQKKSVQFRILEQIAVEEPPLRLTLLASLVKFERFEWLVEKATELGTERIVPVAAARSEKGLDQAAGKRLERWRRIALESSQQSRRARLPLVEPCVPFRDALRVGGRARYLLDESREAPPILKSLPETKDSTGEVCLLVGPEGGWVEDERQAALGAGWAAVSLGPQVLRAETAAVAAMAVLASAWDAAKKQRDLP